MLSRRARHRSADTVTTWRRGARAGALTGLVSSTFSTVFVALGSRHVGRSPTVDFMEVGTVPLRSHAIARRPARSGVAAGIASHQFADAFWAVVFGACVLPRLPRRRRHAAVLGLAAPWALATAGFEYFAALPVLQPWLVMQVPFWAALGVHVASSAAYPLMPALTVDWTHRERRTARVDAVGLCAFVAGLAALRRYVHDRGDPRLPDIVDTDREGDARFLYRMTGHHEVGLRLSELAADRASGRALRALGKLMAAQHRAELTLMHDYWRGWFGGDIPPLSQHDCTRMPGMPNVNDVDALATLAGEQFDLRFAALMVPHHEGGIAMALDERRRRGDPRLRLLADGIVHSQRGQVDRMVRLSRPDRP